MSLLDADQREEAKRHWISIERRVSDVPVASSWTWTETWLRHFGDVVPHRFAIAALRGEPCGATLLCRESTKRTRPVRRLHIGTAGEPVDDGVAAEDKAPLVLDDHQEAFAAGLLEVARADPWWDELWFDALPADKAERYRASDPGFSERREPSPIADLDLVRRTGGDVLGVLRSGPRRRVQRSLREFGRLQTEWARTTDEALDILTELAALHQARWRIAGEPGAFASARFAAFHRDVVGRLMPEGKVALFRVSTSEATVGCVYGFLQGDRLLFYQSGLAAGSTNRARAGLVSHLLFMQACSDEGLREYDFLAGDSRYKRELATGERSLVWLRLSRSRPRTWLLDTARHVKRLLEVRSWS